jgi:hypothetical protein
VDDLRHYEHAGQTHPLSKPLSNSPQRRCSSTKATSAPRMPGRSSVRLDIMQARRFRFRAPN